MDLFLDYREGSGLLNYTCTHQQFSKRTVLTCDLNFYCDKVRCIWKNSLVLTLYNILLTVLHNSANIYDRFTKSANPTPPQLINQLYSLLLEAVFVCLG